MRQLLLSAFACLLPACSFAAKALTEWQTFTQPDGSVLVLTLRGDENGYCYMDQAGHTYMSDSLGMFHIIPQEPESPKAAVRRAGKQLTPQKEWDPDRIYHQMVVLVSFSDFDFKADDPQATYDSIFNERGYNQGEGVGCVADYFRDQSDGRLNLKFDVYGPIKVDAHAKLDNQDEINHGEDVFSEALGRLIKQNPGKDFSPYDWDGDGTVEQIVFVYAGYTGNQTASLGHIWPNTGFVDFTIGDYQVTCFSASGEIWANGRSCGIGTICHEYSHCLGLPDIYPTSKDVSYSSVVDQWDLMDGGNSTNWGWCPPNYSPLEKMLLGWLTPVELTTDTVFIGLKPVAEGGEAILVRHTENEFLLLENRQWQGWDTAAPGQGLLIWHINYDQDAWQDNAVNNTEGTPNCHLIAADNMDYTEWVALYRARGGTNTYQDKTRRLHRCLLSSAPYPWATDSTTFVNRELTDTSVPTAEMYHQNTAGSKLLSKPITDITQHDDGTISFVFQTSYPDNITTPTNTRPVSTGIYQLNGRKIRQAPVVDRLPKGVYITDGKKIALAR